MDESFRIKLRDDVETASFARRGGSRGERAFARIFVLEIADEEEPDIAARMTAFSPEVIAQVKGLVNGDQLVVDGRFDPLNEFGPSLIVTAVSRIDRFAACPIECGGVYQRQGR